MACNVSKNWGKMYIKIMVYVTLCSNDISIALLKRGAQDRITVMGYYFFVLH